MRSPVDSLEVHDAAGSVLGDRSAAEADEFLTRRGLILSASFLRFPRPAMLRYRHAARAPLLWLLRTLRRIPIWLRPSKDPFRLALPAIPVWGVIATIVVAAAAALPAWRTARVEVVENLQYE